jgi:hypothetical protein
MASTAITPSDLLSLADYEKVRPETVRRVIALKTRRRVELGPWVSLVFESRETVLYQIQEMLRIERITDAAMIDHEIETYAELLPGEGELSLTLFIEIPDPQLRAAALSKLGGIETSLTLELAGDIPVPAFDKRPIDPQFERPGQATAVYYLGFTLSSEQRRAFASGAGDVWLKTGHPEYRHAAALSNAQRKELAGAGW